MAYKIAQNVHEIKHSYQNLIKGLGDYFDDQSNAPMTMMDILKIVVDYSQMIIREKQAHINLVVQNHVDITIPRHFYLVTILSNLIINGIDAIGTKRNGELLIKVTADSRHVFFSVTDNGSGIPKNLLPLIFKSGFRLSLINLGISIGESAFQTSRQLQKNNLRERSLLIRLQMSGQHFS